MTAEIVGVILAGGKSNRMSGQDKSFIELGEKSLIQHVIERARPQVVELIINTNNRGDPRYTNFHLPVLADTSPDKFAGPLAGILTGMDYITKTRPNFSQLASFPVDSPFCPQDLVTRLDEALQLHQAKIAIPRYRGQVHWVTGVWSTDLRDNLHTFLVERRQRKMQDWVQQQSFCVVDFDDYHVDPFCNINTPQDLNDAAAHLQESR